MDWIPKNWTVRFNWFTTSDSFLDASFVLRGETYPKDIVGLEMQRFYRSHSRVFELPKSWVYAGNRGALVEAMADALAYIAYVLWPRPKPKNWRLLDKRLVLAPKKFRSRLRKA
jgi:hypothetical protein